MRALNRKLLRDLWHMRGQATAIGLVIACGVATFVMSLSTLESLKLSQQTYYERFRFAQVFAHLKRAPNALAQRIREIPGIAQVQTRVVVDVTLDVEGLAEPAVGRLISVPERASPALNGLYLRRGRYIEPGRRNEALVSDAFAEAHALEPGDTVRAIINGKRETLTIVGVALSPEYVLQIQAGATVPDVKRFGVFWMGYEQLAPAYDMEGAFNDVALTLMHGASEAEVIARLDRLLTPYGSIGAYGRGEQVSHRYLTDEIRGLRGMALVAPVIFLAVAAFLLNVVLARLIRTQREQIAALKAFGYANLEIAWHYLALVLLIALAGVVLGTALGAWLGHGLTQMYTRFYRFPVFYFRFDWGVASLALLISLGAAVGGTFTAVRAAVRLPPAEAMRPEPPTTFRPTLIERMGLQRLFAQSARMVLRQLERHPAKALLSTFGMALAVGVLVLGSFMKDALDHLIEHEYYRVQRYDVSIAFVEPASAGVIHEVRRLPGVRWAEPFRAVPVRLRLAHRAHRTAIMGLEQGHQLYQLLDADQGAVPLPPQGLVLSDKLAELLGAQVGDVLTIEVQEGEQPVRQVRVAGLIADYAGANAYMSAPALHRLLREGPTVSGAFLMVDHQQLDMLYRTLKQTPRVANVTAKEAAVQSFNETVAENQERMRLFNTIFAIVIAFGVVYNTARISLAERSRELATLRVMGFTRAEISFLLLGELAVLTLAALPLGMLIGYGFAAMIVGAFESELFRIPLVVEPSTYAFAATVTLLAATVSGLVVRRRLDHLDLVAVLKARE